MSESLPVKRASRATPLAIVLITALAACDVDVLAPTALAPTTAAASVGALDADGPKFKAGQYPYLGCFSEAVAEVPVPLAPPTVSFAPPVCIPVTLEVSDTGWWSLNFNWYTGYTYPDHPGWTFWAYDLWGWISRNGKCEGGIDLNILNAPTCISVTRYVRQTSFTSYVVASNFGTWYRARVTWAFYPRKS